MAQRPEPDGPVDPVSAPVVLISGGRPSVLTLMAPEWRPPRGHTTQALGLCFTRSGRNRPSRPSGGDVLLVELEGGFWTLPGGTVEPGEELEQTLIREVAEEACSRVIEARYLASQHVYDPEHPDGITSYYQSRWCAVVELDDWDPRHETTARRLVMPEELCREISWDETSILERLLQLAMESASKLGPQGRCS